MPGTVLTVAAVSGFFAVTLGAFGAHGLESLLSADRMATFNVGVQYHMSHSLALLGSGILLHFYPRSRALQAAAIAFILGIIVFSGSLYLLSISDLRWLGAITPVGGVAFLVGWSCLGGLAWSRSRQNQAGLKAEILPPTGQQSRGQETATCKSQ